MNMYPLSSSEHIMHFVNRNFDVLIILVFNDIVIQIWLLRFDAYLIVGLELHGWIHWKYDYT